MPRVYIVVLAFLLVALVALAAAWLYARHVKHHLDESSATVAGTRTLIDVTPDQHGAIAGHERRADPAQAV